MASQRRYDELPTVWDFTLAFHKFNQQGRCERCGRQKPGSPYAWSESDRCPRAIVTWNENTATVITKGVEQT